LKQIFSLNKNLLGCLLFEEPFDLLAEVLLFFLCLFGALVTIFLKPPGKTAVRNFN